MIKIALASDENYSAYLTVAVSSIIDTSRNPQNLSFVILDSGLTEESRNRLGAIINQYGSNLHYIDVNVALNELNIDNSFPAASYARLLLPELIADDRIIYLDCDTLVCDDLVSLWESDLGSSFIAGVFDPVSRFYKESINLSNDCNYVNAGMLVMNLASMRKHRWTDQVLSCIDMFNGSIPHHDQGVINYVLKNEVKLVSPRYNAMDVYFAFDQHELNALTDSAIPYFDQEIGEARNNPAIIHFTAGMYGRPWDIKSTHPLRDMYRAQASRIGLDKGFLQDVSINRNALFMRKIWANCPFWIYLALFRLAGKRKEIKFKKLIK